MRFNPLSCFRRFHPFSSDLVRRYVQTIPHVDSRNRQQKSGERPFVVVAGGFVPDGVRNGIFAIAQARNGLGKREGGALAFGEVRCVSPGSHGKQAFQGFILLLEFARVHVDTHAASIDLAGAQVNQSEGTPRHAGFFGAGIKCRKGLHGFRYKHGGIL